MKSSRRQFMSSAIAGGLAVTAPQVGGAAERRGIDYSRLDEILKQPILKKELFPSPVLIESLELLRYQNRFLCRVRSRDGAEGMSVAHSTMRSLYPIFGHALRPFFIGQDARELDRLLEKVMVYQFNFRYSGMALGIPLATIEFAILDMLGQIANKSIGQLIGEIHHPKVDVYQATEYREKSVEKSLELITRDVAEYNCKAVKIKIGGLMFMYKDLDTVGPPGRTERIIPLIRETFGDNMALYADSNGFYSVDEAIRVSRLLEEYKYGFFEEPVHFDWYEETKQVADAVDIPIAGGEQEYSLHGFRWLVANDGLQIVQPDNYYFGGMIRSMRVALMAHAYGKKCTPHMSGGGLGFLYMIHFVSALPNAADHHEFKGLRTSVHYECKTSPLQVEDGKLTVPTGPGLGVEIAPDFIKKHEVVEF